MKISLAQINPIIGSLAHNRDKIIKSIDAARSRGAQMVIFPEMALCGYPPEDLLFMPSFVQAMVEELETIVKASQNIVVILGTVRGNPVGEKRLFNSAAIIQDGTLVGYQDKILLPDYDVFSERRYFEPAKETKVWNLLGKKIGITICEDIWQHAKAVTETHYSRDPIEELKPQHPDLLINLSSSPYYYRKQQLRLRVCQTAARTLGCPLLYCNQVGCNDSLIFDGYSFYIGSEGQLLGHAKGFEEQDLLIDTDQTYSPQTLTADPIEELHQALVLGVKDYFQKQGFKKGCFGLSGGIDSAVVAEIAAQALGAENILAIGMPSRYSSKESLTDSEKLAKNLSIKFEKISIEKPFTTFLDLLSPHFAEKKPNSTEENLQARIRGMILMAFSNKFGYILLSTGNKSEMAMGYTTLYGDMCGGLGLLNDVTKQQVYALASWINREKEIIPQNIIDKPPSAELRPNQKDQDTLPDYATVDHVLEAYVEDHLSPEEIAKQNKLELSLVKELVRKIHLNEYKRKQAPPGLRVTKKAFTAGRHFPIVQHWNIIPTPGNNDTN